MGKGVPCRPSYTASIATLIAAGVTVRAICESCGGYRDLDLPALAALKGESYDLWGRRTRCRITPGCVGWNRFYVNGRGKFSPMRDG